MPDHEVHVVVYDAPTAASSSCACGCGGHHQHQEDQDPLERVGMELQTKALALTLEKAFPGKVRVEYINVLQDPRAAKLPQTALLCSLAYPAPLIYINGQGRFAGALIPERIREEVGSILESDQSGPSGPGPRAIH
jgi:hypothetical protein